MSTLHLGSGNRYTEGQINVDFYAEMADIRHDLNIFPYPFDSDSFDRIRCENVIEHLDDPLTAMQELHRIGRNGCCVEIRVPHFRSASVAEDITHRRGFAWRTFDVFTETSEIYGNYSQVKYEIVQRYYTPYIFPWLYKILSRCPRITDNLLSKYIPMGSIFFQLKIIKDPI